jgi:hypothetical protein
VLAPFRGAYLDDDMQAWNNAFKPKRVAVEWAFGLVSNRWKYLNFDDQQKIWLQPCAVYYQVGVLLANAMTCCYGCQTSQTFNIAPPSLEEYLETKDPV